MKVSQILAQKGREVGTVAAAGGELAGIISIGDVVRSVIADRELDIRQLENHISGGG